MVWPQMVNICKTLWKFSSERCYMKFINAILICCALCGSVQADASVSIEEALRSAQFVPLRDNTPPAKEIFFKGNERGGQKEGINKIDVSQLSAFRATSFLFWSIVDCVKFVIELAFIVLVVAVIVRAIRRKRNTGSIIPKKEEVTLFDMFDNAVKELHTRRAVHQSELAEIEKRLAPKGDTNVST